MKKTTKKIITKSKGNKKVKNATPNIYKDIKFRSKLEVFFYKLLETHGIEAEYEKHSYTLIDKCEYRGEKVRPITYKPDFVNEQLGFLVEVKGIKTDAFVLRWKLFKRYLSTSNLDWELFMPRNQKECLEVITIIKEKYGTV